MTTTLRRATAADIDAIVAMALTFRASTIYRDHLAPNPEALRTTTALMVASETSVVLVADRAAELIGMIAAHVYVHPMSGELVAGELCLWVEPTKRGGLLARQLVRAAEAWGREHGAQTFQMIAPTERVGAFYTVLGYTRVEVMYQRRL
jgi:GNAT superfamily N-acetyltransferase